MYFGKGWGIVGAVVPEPKVGSFREWTLGGVDVWVWDPRDPGQRKASAPHPYSGQQLNRGKAASRMFSPRTSKQEAYIQAFIPGSKSPDTCSFLPLSR